MSARRNIPIIITATIAALIFAGLFSGFAPLAMLTGIGMKWMIIIGGVASALGAVNLAQVHGKEMMRKHKEWWNSLVLLLVMFSTIIVGITLTPTHAVYRFLFDWVFTPLTTTMVSLLAFFIASAAFRAFRVRSLEAGVLVGAAFLVILGRSAIGTELWSGIPVIGQWILDVPNVGGSRGILLGASLGGIAVFLRVILGIERGHFVG
jgi:cation transport ATPase